MNKTIHFNMYDMINSLNEIIEKKISFNDLINNKAVDNIIFWIKNNPNHKFPKSESGWIGLLNSQFNKIVVKVDPNILINTKYDIKEINDELYYLKEKIIKFMEKERNIKKFKTRDNLMKIVKSFSRLKICVDYSIIIKKLLDLNVINYDFSINHNFYKKKRKLVDEFEPNCDEFYDTELEVSTFNNVKKIRIK
jgi:hypothetical protein